MKIIKRILKFIIIVIGVLVLFIAIKVLIDTQNTNYLKVKNNEFAANNSFLITNVNIIPMNQDTILVDKMVHIKDGAAADPQRIPLHSVKVCSGLLWPLSCRPSDDDPMIHSNPKNSFTECRGIPSGSAAVLSFNQRSVHF